MKIKVESLQDAHKLSDSLDFPALIIVEKIEKIEREDNTEKEIIRFLEGLVHSRYTLSALNELLSEKFKEKISLFNQSLSREIEYDSDELPDYNFIFESLKEDTYGDIYMLPTRETIDGEVVYYVTEVGYEFN